MCQYFLKPYEPFGGGISVKVDLSNYSRVRNRRGGWNSRGEWKNSEKLINGGVGIFKEFILRNKQIFSITKELNINDEYEQML